MVVLLVGLAGVGYSAARTRLSRQNDAISRWCYDFQARVRAARVFDQVLLVQISKDTLAKFGDPVPRRHFARLLDLARRANARLVFFDLVFQQPQSEVDDTAFEKALQSGSASVLGDGLERVPTESGHLTPGPKDSVSVRHLQAISTLKRFRGGERCGLLDLELDADGRVRRLYGSFGNSPHPDFITAAWRAISLLGGSAIRPSAERWLRFYGPAGSVFREEELHTVLERDALPPGTDLVFVGVNQARSLSPQAGEGRDTFLNPYSGPLLPGMEVHATAVLNLLNREYLTRLHPAAQMVFVLLWGTLAIAIVARWKSGWSQGLVLALAVCGAAGSIVLGWWMNHWWPWLIPFGLQTVTALVASAWIPNPPLGEPRVFISYRASQTGETCARMLEQALQTSRIASYLAPDHMAGGDQYRAVLDEAIRKAPNFLLVLTPGARRDLENPTSWVRWELVRAHELKKRIVIVRTRGEGATFSEDQLKEPGRFALRLASSDRPLERFLFSALAAPTQEKLRAAAAGTFPMDDVLGPLVSDLRRIMESGSIYTPERVQGVSLSAATMDLIRNPASAVASGRLNLLILQDAFPGELYGSEEYVAAADLSFLKSEQGGVPEVHQTRFDPGRGFAQSMKEIEDGLR